jgi:hypothetical protein
MWAKNDKAFGDITTSTWRYITHVKLQHVLMQNVHLTHNQKSSQHTWVCTTDMQLQSMYTGFHWMWIPSCHFPWSSSSTDQINPWQNSTDGIVTRLHAGYSGSDSPQAQDILFPSLKCPDMFWDQPSLLSNGHQGKKWPGHTVDHFQG